MSAPASDACAQFTGSTTSSPTVNAEREQRGAAPRKKIVPLGMRCPVERTNASLANFGQLRRNTDRTVAHLLAQLALAIVVLITAKLIYSHPGRSGIVP